MSDVIDQVRAALAGRYRIERELGQGGMATVYLARDLKHDRDVAIKVLRREVAAVVGTSRFLREIDIAAKLSHPHVLALHDSGEANDFLYFVMPHVAGGSLREVLRERGRLSVSDTVRVLHDVADALDYAHGQGVVHRDVKPGNVMLSGRHYVVGDFGIAKALHDATGVTNPAKRDAVGTPEYMAPEQVMADPLIDHRADIYSMGLVGYEMLTGSVPFRSDDPSVLLRLQVTKAPAPIASRRKGVPRRLARAVEKCLEKDPDDRWPSAAAFLRELDRAAKPSRLVPMAAGVLAGAVALGAIGVAVTRSESALVAERVVVSALDNQTGDPAFDDVGSLAAHWITQGLQRTDAVDVVPTSTALRSLQHVEDEVESGRVADPVRALAEETAAGTVISGAIYEAAERLQFQVQITDANRGRVIVSITEEGEPNERVSDVVDRLRDRITGALAVTFDEQLSIPPNGEGALPTLEAYRAFKEGMGAYTGTQYRDAIPHFQRARDVDSTFALPLLFEAVSNLNIARWEAADSLTRELALYRDRLSQYHRYWLEYLESRVEGNDEGALNAMRRASALAPSSKASYNRALMALRTRRPREAFDALDILDADRGPMRGWLPYWNQRTWALHELGDYEGELESAREARKRHPGRLRAMQLETDALGALGRYEEVDSLLQEAGHYTPDNRTVGLVAYSAAREMLAHGHEEHADRLFDRVVEWHEAQPPEVFRTLAARHQYGIALFYAGRFDDAERLYLDIELEAPWHRGARLYLGLIAAQRNDFATAREMQVWFEGLDSPYSFGQPEWSRARIALSMGDSDNSAALFARSMLEGRGVRRFRPHADLEYVHHRDDPALEVLFRPRG